MTGEESTFTTFGNNPYHDPSICEDCEMDTCALCSNGFRGHEYRRAEAEMNWPRHEVSWPQWED